MEKEKDDIICICTPAGRDNYTVGISVPCVGTCGRNVWLSDSTIATIKQKHPNVNLEENPPKPVCIECGLAAMKGKAEFMELGDKQKEEIVSLLKDLKSKNETQI